MTQLKQGMKSQLFYTTVAVHFYAGFKITNTQTNKHYKQASTHSHPSQNPPQTPPPPHPPPPTPLKKKKKKKGEEEEERRGEEEEEKDKTKMEKGEVKIHRERKTAWVCQKKLSQYTHRNISNIVAARITIL